MRKTFIALACAVVSVLWTTASFADEGRSRVQPETISLFQVPWQCPAAPEIACGGLAKPVLLELEQNTGIAEAWINRTGTVLAVVGSDRNREARTKTVRTLLQEIFEKDVATELQGEARTTELASFRSDAPWYRAAQVDALSIEEADIIAARLVHRIEAKVALSEDKTRLLTVSFADILKARFIRSSDAPRTGDQKPRDEQLRDIARAQLGTAGVSAFDEALAKGERPAPGEK
ncbi:hypothetical protein OVY48_06190 [Sphingobium sp. SA2]|uniref:hypothetical protein n=1 Tax=Sphingobium sp. SA2 TaxID=1524832 RepID=UPI0028C01A5F|nr:hypothetical protein [Sphingobium sp. SA2]MDT7533027.1 hypothetical protein [Sphingobium sp. SA2]